MRARDARDASSRPSSDEGMRGLPEDGQPLGSPPDLPVVQPRRLLRRFAESSRLCALPRDAAPGDHVGRSRRDVGLLLSRRPVSLGTVTGRGVFFPPRAGASLAPGGRRMQRGMFGAGMTQPSSTVQPSVPAAYADQLVQLVRNWGVTAAEILAPVGLSESAVQDPHGRLSVETFGVLLERARTLTREPGLGFYLGLQKRISMYGYLGVAAMTAGSLREALEMFVRFTPTLTTSIGLRLHVEGRLASLFIEEHFDLGAARDIALINLMVGMREIGRTLTGRTLDGEHADIALPEPPYLHRFKHLMPNTRWGQPE